MIECPECIKAHVLAQVPSINVKIKVKYLKDRLKWYTPKEIWVEKLTRYPVNARTNFRKIQNTVGCLLATVIFNRLGEVKNYAKDKSLKLIYEEIGKENAQYLRVLAALSEDSFCS